MKKKFRLLAILMAVFMAVSIMPSTAFAAGENDTMSISAEPAGEGTQEEPYRISSADELIWFAEEVNGSTAKSTSTLCAILTQDIDLTGKEWTPIGNYNSYSDCVYYGGVFDGNGKIVSGLTIDSTKQYQALFGYVKGATVRNLTVRGRVTTSVSSSAYAAGIVGYGYPVNIENCTSDVKVTATAKGYVAGIAGYASSGSSIINCTNNGAVSGVGDCVGGIVATAMGTTIQNCFNHGSISDTGTPGSYSYSVGGIAGSISSSSVISMCGNTGEITSTIKRTGGIAGNLGGSVEKCFNTGNVTGIYGVGGIAGDSSAATTTITSCYNTGKVTVKAPTVSFTDTNAKGAGGIIGGVSSNSYKADLKNCYNVGSVTLEEGAVTDVTAGGVVGNSSGKNYSGVETSGLITAANCYYLETAASGGDGHTDSAEGMTAKADSEMKTSDFVSSLGSDYIAGKDGGYPLLGWQDPDAVYKIQFTLEPSGAALVVKDEDGQILDPSDGTVYELKNGTYSYEVTGEECETVEGNFTVAYGGQNISVSLNVKKYDYKFITEPTDAELSVDGQTPLADGRTYQLAKAGNPYHYVVKAYGYEPVEGDIRVTGNADADKLSVTLEKQVLHQVSFPVTKEADGLESDVLITIRSNDYPSAEILSQEDGSFALPDGSYTYKVSSAGYKSVGGSFTVSGADVTLPEVYLEIQRAWDGTSYDEPTKDADGVYQITTPNELMWFNKNADLTDSAKLLADIRINEDMTADVSSLYEWTPMGTSSSKMYTGSFDGNGHTIFGLYVNTTSNYTGMFGYVGAGGSICDLTLSDSNINCTLKYVGAIAGDLKGTIKNCHTEDTVSVTGQAYVGGIVGELDSGASVSGCSNAGTVTGTGTTASNGYVGGIAARVYSNLSTALTDCYNSGSISGSSFVGGVTGSIYLGGTVKNVYNTGSAAATLETGAAGGLVGQLRMGSIINAYNAGPVSAASAGAVIGSLDYQNGSKTLEAVYYLNGIADAVIGKTNNYTIQTGEAKSIASEELQNLAGVLGEGFADDDNSVNSGYPVLIWQNGVTADDPNAPVPDPNGWDGKTAAEAPEQINGVYQISTAAELKWFARAAKTTPAIEGVLTADIDLNNQVWTPVGGTTAETAFSGSLDGNGYTISNMYLKAGNGVGLVAYNKGEIKDVTVSGNIRSADNAAAIAGYNAGKITGVTSNVKTEGGNFVAGIAANNAEGGSIEKCINNGNVTGGSYVGGITASNKRGTVSGCVNSGMVYGRGTFAGGIAADNDGGTVTGCANSGHVVGLTASQLTFVSGGVGRNDGTVDGIYNSGNIVSMGSGVGGCVGINTSGSQASRLYGAGDVCGSYIDTETGEEFRVGGAVGEVNSGVSEAYYLETLTVKDGGTVVSADVLSEKAGALAEMISEKDAINGTVTIGAPEAEETAKPSYTGNAENPVYVWYTYDGYDETVVSVSEEYEIPAWMVGYILHVKVMDKDLSGIVTGESEKIDGFRGSVKISGYAVVGHVITAVYTGEDENPTFQWYRGDTRIEGAVSASYTVTEADWNKTLKVRVRGSKPGYIDKTTAIIRTGEEAGIWPEDECAVPVKDSEGTYLISGEKELRWFAGFVNSGNSNANAQVTENITLTSENWYPIGNSTYPYSGQFDGNEKQISGLAITSSKDEQGLFGNIGGEGVVKDISVSGTVTITGGEAISAGGIAGYLDGKIANCSFNGSISGVNDAGGIVGQSGLNSKVSQCINTASVQGKENVGGIAGSSSYGNIYECVNKGTVGSEGAVNVGGIAGSITNYAVVCASYNTGSVTGEKYLGGIAGKASVCAAPQGCYNAGPVSAGIYAFGVLGDLSGTEYIATTKGSYYLTESEETATDKTATGVSAQGMKKEVFVSLLNAQAGAEYFCMATKNENNGFPVLLWETGLPSGGTTEPDDPDPEKEISVSFTLRGDTAHGKDGAHTEYIDWIAQKTYTIKEGSTAYDLFKLVMEENDLTYEAKADSYVSSVTGPDGTKLAEFTNGPRSGWMYTINDEFPDYMSITKLKTGDNMVFFYTDDYRETGWDPEDPVVAAVEEMIDEIGEVTLESEAAIQKARDAYELLDAEQKAEVENYDELQAAESRLSDLKAAKDVYDQISVLPSVEDLLLSDQPAVEAVRAAYGALTDAQKELVTNEETLKMLEIKLASLKEDEEAAREVEEKISALPDTESLELSDQPAVEAAQAAFEALSDSQKALVSQESKDALQEAAERIAVLQAAENEAAAQAVEEKISLLPGSADVKLSDKAEVKEAKDAYEGLTDEQKELVSEEAKAALEAVESRLAELEEQIDSVIEMISSLPGRDELDFSDRSAVEAARAAYDALTEEQKERIPKDAVTVLEEAEEKLDGLTEGFDREGSDWYYYSNGKKVTTSKDIVYGTIDGSSGWYYIEKGKFVKKTSVEKNKNGWFYVKDGKVDFTYTGFASNVNGDWYVERGKVRFDKYSVIQDTKGAIGVKGTWYYVVKSKVQADYTGIANYKNANGWWYIRKGKVDFSYTGFASNNKGDWYASGGKVRFNANSVIKDTNGALGKQGTWYYVVKSKVTYTNTVAKNANGWWVIQSGKVNFGFKGIASNNYGTWYIKAGKVQFGYSGTIKVNGKTYKIKNGKVV